LQDKTLQVDQITFLRLDHENLVTYLGCSMSSSLNQTMVYTVSERVIGNSLSTIIYLFRDFTMEDNWTVAQRIAQGMLYLHSNGIAHKSLKPTNILVYGDKLVKISDYHIQDILHQTKQHTISTSRQVSTSRVNLGTLSVLPCNMKHNVCWYHSPQILNNSIGSEEKEWMAADVYAFGMVLYELFMKKAPWDLDSEAEIRQMVCSGKRPIFPQEFIADKRGKTLAQLITCCWEGNSFDRPTFQEIVKVLSNEESSSLFKTKSTQVNQRTSVVHGPTQSTQSTRVSASHCPHPNQSPVVNHTGSSTSTAEVPHTSTRVSAKSLQQHKS